MEQTTKNRIEANVSDPILAIVRRNATLMGLTAKGYCSYLIAKYALEEEKNIQETLSPNPFSIHLTKESSTALLKLLESGSSTGWDTFRERTKGLPKIPSVQVDPKDLL